MRSAPRADRRADRPGVLAALVLAPLLVACSPPPALDIVVEADPDRAGLDGLLGPHGAARYSARTMARVDELVRYEVVVPVAADGRVPDAGPFPVVVFVHGGFVEVERYLWFGEHLATRGFVSVHPDHDANLALLSSGNALAAVDDLLADSAAPDHPLADALDAHAPASIFGHSLGGVVAAEAWSRDPDRWLVLGIAASFPAGTNNVERFTERPSIHLVGSEDEPDAKRENGFDRFAEPRLFGVVEGMNHYAWTDDATESELSGDGARGRPNSETRQDAWRVMDTWLDVFVRGDAQAVERLEDGDFPGVEVVR